MILQDKYQNYRGAMPAEMQSEEDFLDAMRYYYSAYAKNNGAIGFAGTYMVGYGRRTFAQLRDHGRGMQNPEKYKDQLDPFIKKGKNKGKRRWNISWDIVKLIPKFRSITVDKITSIRLGPDIEALDDEAKRDRLIKKNQVKLSMLPEQQMFMEGSGYSMQTGMEGVDSPSDVDFLYQVGGLKLEVEMAIKDALDEMIEDSDWNVLSQMIADDLVDLNCFAFDQVWENGVRVLKYVDPAKLVIMPSIYKDFRDRECCGYIHSEKITNIKLTDPTIPDDKIEAIKKVYGSNAQTFGYPRHDSGTIEDYAPMGSGYGNEFGVDVLTMYFLSTETEYYVTGKSRRGSRQFEQVDKDFQLSERGKKAGKRIEEYPITKMYKCNWVIGTDVVYGYGEIDNIVPYGKDGNLRPVWPMVIYMGNEPSLVERVIGFDDDIQMDTFKIRSMISKLPPAPRMIVFQSLIKDTVNIAGEEFTILDMASNFQSEGIWVMDEAMPFSLPGEDVNYGKDPIRFLPSGIAEDLQILTSNIMRNFENIRQGWGINPVADGTSQDPDMLKSVMQGLQQATNSALAPFIKQFVNGYERMVKNLAAIGRLFEGKAFSSWKVSVRAVTAETIQFMMQDLMSRKDLLDESSYFIIWNMLVTGDVEKAQYMMAKFSKIAKEQQHAKEIQIAQATAQGNAQAAQAAEAARAQTVQAEAQAKIIVLAEEHKLKLNEMDKAHLLQLEFAREKSRLDTEQGLAITKANNQNRLNQ